MELDFKQIVARCGSEPNAFEELCCQLGRRNLPEDARYRRFHGAGGDGGVESLVDFPNGRQIGWQAKYVFDIGSLITQATASFNTALKIHPELTQYIVCFPFDLTGPTGRKGLSSQEKFDNWRTEQEKNAVAAGCNVSIIAWPAFKIRDLLLEHDASGGIREFFFNQKILTDEWFSEHLLSAQKTAGPRYTPELNVQTDLWKWFAAFGRTELWSNAFSSKIRSCREALDNLISGVRRTKSDELSPAWLENSCVEAQALADDLLLFFDECDHLISLNIHEQYKNCVRKLAVLLDRLAVVESKLLASFEQEHGEGRADSPGFRQFMAEYMVSFPTANIDVTRENIAQLKELHSWLQSPACALAYSSVFALSGDAGSGKTHGVCDAAGRLVSETFYACVTFGHEFGGEPDPWTRISETLGLPITLGMNGLLDMLNAAGEASDKPLILFVDAINETKPLRYWRDRLAAVVETIQRRPYLRLCITCRTSFLPHCLPEKDDLPIIEHTGFAGIERDACQTFFQYYELKPPIAPILQPELANPLYLRLLCETLRSRGLCRIPSGWQGIAPTIRAFLQEKERQFAIEFETSEGAAIVRGSLMTIVRTMVAAELSSLSWSKAQRVVAEERPQAATLPVLEWLVRSDLLVEDAPVTDDFLDSESAVRPAFERLGDFLIAMEILDKSSRTGLEAACRSGGLIYNLTKDHDSVTKNTGILAALSVILPEKNSGSELPNLFLDDSVRISLLQITVRALPSRDPASFSSTTQYLMQEALSLPDFSYQAMDAVLATSWQQSIIDAFWLDRLLKQKLMSLRDAYWCGYLHKQYESRNAVYRLIYAAFELPLEQLDNEIAERWATMLLWFTAAADRRVKDWATRAAIVVLKTHPRLLPSLVERMIGCDDDEVLERTLLICYGVLILSPDLHVIPHVVRILQEAYCSDKLSFDNALIRDHIRCIGELAARLHVLPEGCNPELTMQPIHSEWPQELPSDEQIETWGEILHFGSDEFFSDFYKYSMNCLRPWMHAFPKQDMGKWIVQRIMCDFRYEGSDCERYDGYMLGQYGGGRGKPRWAERIGKKYQWIALYQLAARLHDHIKRDENSWEPEPISSPMILLEERKLDPTLLLTEIVGEDRNADAWWIGDSPDFQTGEQLTDQDWVNTSNDLPRLDKLLSAKKHDGQDWLLLASYLSWNNRDEDSDQQYRDVWLHLESYLVAKDQVDIAYECLHRRNFFGHWMPEGASWLYGFAGEYPWATPFNLEPDEWHGGGRQDERLPVNYIPSWNELTVEWEYDASLENNFSMFLPARTFFSSSDLWWNGQGGYGVQGGKTVFRDASSTSAIGPKALLADREELLTRLDKLGYRLIWTVLGEKWILGGGHNTASPRRTFSQIARLEKDGSVHIGERVFVDDYNKDAGPKLS
ncbi:MAG: hypothetical protein V8K32_03395 [Candidatus Electrothrix gigas]